MAAEHALLAIHPDGVCVEPLLGDVLIDHVPHKDVVKRLPFFTVFGLGTTYLAIGPEDAAWPALAVPPPPPPAWKPCARPGCGPGCMPTRSLKSPPPRRVGSKHSALRRGLLRH